MSLLRASSLCNERIEEACMSICMQGASSEVNVRRLHYDFGEVHFFAEAA